jgi:ubiquinone/menaquinone biosynthesis C-methylase UbiE
MEWMEPVQQYVQRAFWGLYGRLVWDAHRSPDHAARVQHIVDVLAARRGGLGQRVLDAGCGTGDHTLALAGAGFQVTGIDYAEGMVVRAREKVPESLAGAISFRQMDLNSRLEFPDARFDHVINISVLQVVADPGFTLGQFWRVLRPGGTLLLLHVPRPDSHDLPLRQAISARTRELENRTLWRVGLVAAKVWAERAGKPRYWTVPELQEMLRAARFKVQSVNPGPPIVMVAEKGGG